MLFVGDNLYADVHGAQRCGMRAVHFLPAVRGSAVAPEIAHGLEIVPDATVRTLQDVLGIVATMELSGQRPEVSGKGSRDRAPH
jgi:FMN phosphatase YigB (HAD superfamily)